MKINGREHRTFDAQGPTSKDSKGNSRTDLHGGGLSETVKGLVRKPKPEVVAALGNSGDEANDLGERFLTRIEMAKALKISLRTLAKMLAQGAIPRIRIGNRMIRFRLADVVQHLSGQGGNSQSQTANRPGGELP